MTNLLLVVFLSATAPLHAQVAGPQAEPAAPWAPEALIRPQADESVREAGAPFEGREIIRNVGLNLECEGDGGQQEAYCRGLKEGMERGEAIGRKQGFAAGLEERVKVVPALVKEMMDQGEEELKKAHTINQIVGAVGLGLAVAGPVLMGFLGGFGVISGLWAAIGSAIFLTAGLVVAVATLHSSMMLERKERLRIKTLKVNVVPAPKPETETDTEPKESEPSFNTAEVLLPNQV